LRRIAAADQRTGRDAASPGARTCLDRGSCGTVFSITTGGTEKVLHSFGSGGDGAWPEASLIEAKGKLYGTTLFGGAPTKARFLASRQAAPKECSTASAASATEPMACSLPLP
jgi:hypothetical protein